jgi:hypothetical protein
MRGVDMKLVKRPIFVLMFVAIMIFGTALVLSTMVKGSEPPIETDVSTLSSTVQ